MFPFLSAAITSFPSVVPNTVVGPSCNSNRAILMNENTVVGMKLTPVTLSVPLISMSSAVVVSKIFWADDAYWLYFFRDSTERSISVWNTLASGFTSMNLRLGTFRPPRYYLFSSSYFPRSNVESVDTKELSELAKCSASMAFTWMG